MKNSPVSFVSFGIALALAAGGLTGCGTYRVVKRTANGGEVALQGSPEKAREKADEYMSAQCPTGFEIVEEGEAVIGQDTQASTSRGSTVFGVPTQNTTASTTDKREWRIKYQCKGAKAQGAQGAVRELVIRF